MVNSGYSLKVEPTGYSCGCWFIERKKGEVLELRFWASNYNDGLTINRKGTLRESNYVLSVSGACVLDMINLHFL